MTNPATSLARCPRCQDVKPREAFATRTNGFRAPYCRPCTADYMKARWADGRGVAKHNAATKQRRAAEPEKARARDRVRNALRSGAVVKQPCYRAGPECSGGVEAHHADYAKPLDVTWTCRRHHWALDRARSA